jgi:urease accessory protein
MRVTEVLPAGSWDAAREVDRVLVDYDGRFRRRIVLTTVLGADVLIDLPQAARLRDGDGLFFESGIVRVCAQDEDLMEIHAHHTADLVRIAWHLGNRHLPVQLLGDHVRIRADHVIADMIKGLGGHVETLRAPFDPEAGAYSGGGSHHHDDDNRERRERRSE